MKRGFWHRIPALLVAVAMVAVFLSACGGNSAASPPPKTNADGSITYYLKADNSKFDTSRITVPAGAQITIAFNNAETVQHNFALYQDSTAASAIFRGGYIGKTTTNYTFTAPSQPGTYYFKCDLHPDMNGQFIVT